MRNVSQAFRRTLWEDKRVWLPYVDITLTDGTKLPQFTKETLWTSGLSFEAAVSEDDKFTAVGAAIMGVATVVLDNTGEKWNNYDFNDADVNIKLGLEVDGTPEILQIGRYTVESAVYNGAVVTLSLLDYMHQFDRVYNTPLNYPATLGDIVSDACAQCGVSLAPNYTTFPHYDYRVETKPAADNTTYRDVVAWAAQIAGCFAVFNGNGRLEFKWFGGERLQELREGYDGGEFDAANPYATGDAAEGGSFNPWNLGAELDGGLLTEDLDVHYISSLFTENISLDDTVITGVQVSAEREVDGDRETVIGFAGTDGYVIALEGNKLLSLDDVQAIATWVGSSVIGLTFRKSRATHLSDPSIEAGDVALLLDHKGREYPILVTRTRFTTGGRQETVCGSETPARNRAKQFSQETKNYVDLNRKLKATKDSWDLAEERLRQDILNSSGLFETDVDQTDGSVKKYYHNKRTLEESDIVMTFNDRGFLVTSNYNADNPDNSTWYGLTVDGDLLTEILYAHKVDAAKILTGRIQDATNTNFWDLATGEFQLTLGAELRSNGSTQTLEQYIEGELSDYDDSLTQTKVFSKLTNNGALRGLYMSNNRLYLNADYIASGKLASKDGNTYWDIDNNEIKLVASNTKVGTKKLDTYLDDKTNAWIEANPSKIKAAVGEFEVDADEIRLKATKLTWNSTYSSLDQYGNLSAQNAILTGADVTGTIRTVDGSFETIMDEGWIYFKRNGDWIGKIGAAVVDETGNCFNINSMGSSNGFGIYNGGTDNAEPLLTWVKSSRTWDHEGSVFNWNSQGTNYMTLHNAALYVPLGNIYSQGNRVLTTADINVYQGGYIKWKSGDNGHIDGT